jgi:hypothetical protein
MAKPENSDIQGYIISIWKDFQITDAIRKLCFV